MNTGRERADRNRQPDLTYQSCLAITAWRPQEGSVKDLRHIPYHEVRPLSSKQRTRSACRVSNSQTSAAPPGQYPLRVEPCRFLGSGDHPGRSASARPNSQETFSLPDLRLPETSEWLRPVES